MLADYLDFVLSVYHQVKLYLFFFIARGRRRKEEKEEEEEEASQAKVFKLGHMWWIVDVWFVVCLFVCFFYGSLKVVRNTTRSSLIGYRANVVL